jgi:hypothetical protein
MTCESPQMDIVWESYGLSKFRKKQGKNVNIVICIDNVSVLTWKYGRLP